MELKILTTFKTIIRTGSFSKAARQLNYTPPQLRFTLRSSRRRQACGSLKRAVGAWF